MVARALADALGAFLPAPLETALVRTCLLPGEEARRAWELFTSQAGDLRELFRADFGRMKRLGPMVAYALRRIDARVDPAVLTVLRTAYVREQLRANAYDDILRDVLSALDRERIPLLLVRGAAWAHDIYPEAALRHAHDIDLLVRPEDRAAAVTALAATGLQPVQTRPRGIVGTSSLEHRTLLPINLHTRLLEPPLEPPTWPDLWQTRRKIPGLDGPATVSLEHALLLTVGQAATSPARASLQWVLDACLALEHAPGFDWARFAAAVRRASLALPAWVMLRYLAAECGAQIPAEAVAALEAQAAQAAAPERDRALFLARLEPDESVASLVRRGSTLGARLTILRWLLFPSPAYIRGAYGVQATLGLPAAYLRRFVAHARG